MKKLIFFAIAFMFFGIFFGCSDFDCSEKNVTQKSITRSEPKEEKSIKETLAEELLAEFQDDLESWNACIIYDGYEYTSLEDFRNRDK